MGQHEQKRRDSHTGTGAQGALAPPLERPRVLELLQQQLGNAVIERLLLDQPASPFEHYLSDLLAAEQATGLDFSPYLPGLAPQEWTRFTQSWYRVAFAERTAEPAAAPEPQAAAPIARKGRGRSDLDDPAQLEAWFQDLQARGGGGRPLTAAEQAFLSRVHDRVPSGTRVHEGSLASQASEDIAARAFTVGTDIYAGDSVSLSSREGAALLAHELTHVIQHVAGRTAGAPTAVSSPGQPLEVEAELAERRAGVTWGERKEAWAFAPPAGLDSRAEYLSDYLLGQLPSRPGTTPAPLVRDALRHLLAQQARQRLDEARATLLVSPEPDLALLADVEAWTRRVAQATAEREDLLVLLQLAGAPTAAELAPLAATWAPYPGIGDQLAAVLDALHTQDPLESAARSSTAVETDADPDRAAATLALVRRLAPQLGLSPDRVDLHVDADAADKVRSAGTRGLAEGRSVFLDLSAFQPGTADARGLVAHELTHVAQQGLDPASGPMAGALAEAEAAETAWRASSGGALSAPEFGLPTSHVAAEGGGTVVGGDMLGKVAAVKEGVNNTAANTTGPSGGPSGGQDPNATEDSEKKLEQYEDGVDGVADLIGDLDAFDDLCDAIDDDEPTSGPLSRVKRSEHYGRLSKMWQGAKEGGDVSGAMMRAFNNEFDGRGFWAETEATTPWPTGRSPRRTWSARWPWRPRPWPTRASPSRRPASRCSPP